MILGVDEVGRGPWAGPLVVGAVVLGCEIEGLTDSKKLSAKRRVELAAKIHEKAAGVGLGWVYADEIDEIGLSQALVEATKRAVGQITAPYHEIIIDGTINFLAETGKGKYVTTMKKADLLIASVSAASIVAKVARDTYMAERDVVYPEYGFGSHVGYGTAKHRAAIEQYGVTPLHRLSFAPVAKFAQSQSASIETASRPTFLEYASGNDGAADVSLEDSASCTPSMTTKQIGDRAEEIVAEYLRQNGHEIIERNWKTKFCEIDIISQKDDTVYFTEVKYRKNDTAGGGIAAITPKKLRQMKFAAEYFAVKNQTKGVSLILAAASVQGEAFTLQGWLTIE